MDFEPVCKTSDLDEGGLVAYEVGGEYVALACVEGRFYAFADVCTHRGCSLSEGELEGRTVTCPCHAGEFDISTGEVLDGPPPEPVEVYEARVIGDDVEIAV